MIEFARREDIPALKEIWRACFDDTQTYIDSHYAHGRDCMRTLIHREPNGTVSSMLEMVDVTMRFGKVSYPAFYIYAASTLPAYQGRRLMHRLIERSCEIAAQEGMVASVLIPQTPSLVAFYDGQGYTRRIPIGERNVQAQPCSALVEELSLQEFCAMKAAYEQNFACCLEHSPALSGLIYQQTTVSDGKILKICQNARQAYAVCYKIKEQGFIQEISSGEDVLIEDVSAVCSYLGVASARVLRPGTDRLYGLVRPLGDQSLPWEDLYMNTMLD